ESDRVFVKRRKVNIKLGDDNPRILIYHKPAGEIVSRDDPEQRDTVFDRLPRPDHGKWVAMGRLDYNTEGLLLFTTYGELANRMMHPRYEILREYSVRILGELTPEQEDELIDGIELDDGPARVLSLDRIDRDSDGANHWYRITLNEGRNREVRRMFEHLGLTVSRLIRTRYGVVNMPSWLKRGQFKLLDENDTFNILESVGLRSRKKLEKAARFGGARGKLPQGPVGPMRSATEHEAIWTGAPAPGAGMPGARGDRRNGGRNGRGNPRGREARGGDQFGASLSLQQQQFPGFGGASAAQPGQERRGRNQRFGRGGEGGQRRGGGDVNGNVAPGYRANGQANGNNQGRGRNNRRGRGRDGNVGNVGNAAPFDPNVVGTAANDAVGFEPGNTIEGAPNRNPNGNQRRGRNDNGRNNNGRGRNNRRGNNGGGRWNNAAPGEGLPPNAEGFVAPTQNFGNEGAPPINAARAPGEGGEQRRGPRGRRFGNRGRRPRSDAAVAGDAPPPVVVNSDE
ncbi:MAG: pseudouridine synthase, partial [Casimicrobium sp.]